MANDWTVTRPDVTPQPAAPPAVSPCRCGARDHGGNVQRRDFPVQDLRDDPLGRVCTPIAERPLGVKSCWACDHAVGVGDYRATAPGSSVHDYFHAACVVHDPFQLMPGDVALVTYATRAGDPATGHLLVLATHYPPDARPQARLRAPADLADAHRDPTDPTVYRVYADTILRITDPAAIAAAKENQTT